MRRSVFPVVAALVLLAGCTAPLGAKPAVTDDEAKNRSVHAEEAYLSGHLRNASCLENWGTSASTVSENADVRNRTERGVVVEVRQPYWYSTDSSQADTASHARYLVTQNDTERLSGDGVHPC